MYPIHTLRITDINYQHQRLISNIIILGSSLWFTRGKIIESEHRLLSGFTLNNLPLRKFNALTFELTTSNTKHVCFFTFSQLKIYAEIKKVVMWNNDPKTQIGTRRLRRLRRFVFLGSLENLCASSSFAASSELYVLSGANLLYYSCTSTFTSTFTSTLVP